jgi:hypothetical protein
MLFPDGRLLSRRWLWVAVPPGIATLATVVLGASTDTLTGQNVDYRIENPIGIEGLAPVEDLPVFGALGVLLGVGVLGAIASVAVRFRRSRGIERQQMKWFLYPVAFLWLFFVIDYLPGIVGGLVFGAIVVGQPVAMGIAVLRYRLYKIDIVINRTLAIAALFSPLRRRIQAFIDKRFYRRKYDARKTLEAFSARLREETDLGTLTDDLRGVVGGTMQPEHVSLWLRPETAPQQAQVD